MEGGPRRGTTTNIQCPLCGRSYAKAVIELHAANCEGRYEEEEVEVERSVSCPLCSRQFSTTTIESHAANCGEDGVLV